jgi:DNA-binding transcriptional LysR family regulator
MLDLAAVRSLIAVRDHGSVGGAAEALGFTPSAVSQQVKRLERQSGCSMLEHVGRGVILTERGRLLAQQGQRLLGEMEELENLALGDGRDPTGEFRIAAFSTACRGLVAPLLTGLARTAPDLSVRVHEIDPRECIGLVERGGADLGIVHDWKTLPLDFGGGLEAMHLMDDVADVLLAIDHPLASAEVIEPDQLTGERWVSTHAGTICDDLLNQLFALRGVRPDIRFRDGSFGTHVALVQEGVAVALLPRLGRGPLPDSVRAIPLVNPTPQRHVYSLWRRASTDNHVRRHVQEQLELITGRMEEPLTGRMEEPITGPAPEPVSRR